MNILDKIDIYISEKEDDEKDTKKKKCKEGYKWWPVRKKCIPEEGKE